MYEVTVRDTFSAAHRLAGYKGKCEELHGHNWKVEASFLGKEVGKEGMLLDFTEAKAKLKEVLSKLDHLYLNEIPPFDRINPTSENLARFIFEKLKAIFPSQSITLSKVTVWEGDTASASFYESL